MMTETPQSILIVGGGCFGISTALELSNRPAFTNCKLTLIDASELPNKHNSSWDINRIVRADYTDTLYASLAEEAMDLWRNTSWGGSGRYTESGLLLVGDTDAIYIAGALALAKQRGVADQVKEFVGEEQIRQACRTGGSSGSQGYLNRRAGWVDAEKSMTFACEQLKHLGRVEVIAGKVVGLTTAEEAGANQAKVTGVSLADGSVLSADLTIIAAGSYSPTLLDLRGVVAASAEVFAYIELTDKQVDRLKDMPAIINLSKGWFVVPPNGRQLKIARHGLGFSNPTKMAHSMIPGTIQISVPSLSADSEARITEEWTRACRKAVRELIPWLEDAEIHHTRIFWYTDTHSGDFIIDYHPQHAGLFVATGGSGHAFKFLPVIGKCVVDRIEHKLQLAYTNLWSWPANTLSSEDEVRRRAYIARGGVLNVEQ